MEAPLELVHVDLMTDFKGHANYHYALVAVDDFSSLIYVVSWAWMLKKQEGHWFIWKEHRYRRPSRYQ